MAGINDLLKALTVVKPGDDVEEVASSTRMNAIQELVRALVRGDNVISGLNVRKQSQDGWVILSANPTGPGGGGRINLPFAVSSSGFGVTVYPGTISRVGPTIFGTALTADPAPVFSGIGSDFTLLLKVTIDLTHGVNFRGGVTTVIVSDSLSEADYADVGELTVQWDASDHNTGVFFLRIADIKVDGTGAMSVKQQWLYSSYDSFLINDPDVIVIAGGIVGPP